MTCARKREVKRALVLEYAEVLARLFGVQEPMQAAERERSLAGELLGVGGKGLLEKAKG